MPVHKSRVVGWLFVFVQFVLLVALVVLPGRDDWATPAWIDGAGFAVILGGLAVVAIAALRLGSALTPSPVPTARGTLSTDGLFTFVRHPIYSGVLLIVIGLTIPSGSFVTAAVAAVTVAFFHVKARWEERRLAERYPDYAAYAARTPRFVPRRIRRL